MCDYWLLCQIMQLYSISIIIEKYHWTEAFTRHRPFGLVCFLLPQRKTPLSHLTRRLTNPVATNAMYLPSSMKFIILRTGCLIVLCLLLNKFYKMKKNC